MIKTSSAHTFSARVFAAASSFVLISSLIGCGLGGSNVTSTTPSPVSGTPVPAMHGSVHGGQQPISGASIQLYAAGSSGYGTGATPLIPTGAGIGSIGYLAGGAQCTITAGNLSTCLTTVTTDSTGSFNISNDYSCTTGQLVYIVATGGNPTGSGTVNNSNIALMAALGPCPSPGGTGAFSASIPVLQVNEVTTVAAVWALQNFMAPPTGSAFAVNIGAPSTTYSNGLASPTSFASGTIGLTNAFKMASILSDVSTGYSPNLNFSYATPESGKINTAADVLAYCVNSDPGVSSNCSALLTHGTGGVVPSSSPNATDTVQAAYYMAQNPSFNVATACGLGGPTPPFAGTACASINDWTIAVNFAPTYTLSGATTFAINEGYGIGIDAYGNAWIVNAGGLTGSAAAGVVELGVDGSAITTPAVTLTPATSGGVYSQFTSAPATGAVSFTAPTLLAIDLNNNAWVSDTGLTAGVPTSTPVAFVPGSTSSQKNGTGSIVPTVTGFWSNYTTLGIAIDGSNNVYTASSASSSLNQATLMNQRSVGKMAADGSGYTYSTSASTSQFPPTNTPGGTTLLAVDANNTAVAGGILWALDSSTCKVQGQGVNATTTWGLLNEYSASAVTTSLAGSQVATTASNVSIGTSGTCGSTSVKPAQAITAIMSTPAGIAIDKNNNVWLTDQESGTAPALSGFDGLTLLTAPDSSGTGTIPSSFNLVNGALGSSTTNSTPGTTLNKSTGIAIDGNNNAWIASSSLHSVAEATFNGTTMSLLTPTAAGVGFVHTVAGSQALAIDPSGNVWVTNKNATSNYTNSTGVTTPDGNSVTVIVGAAGPVVTPLSLALHNNRLGQKP